MYEKRCIRLATQNPLYYMNYCFFAGLFYTHVMVYSVNNQNKLARQQQYVKGQQYNTSCWFEASWWGYRHIVGNLSPETQQPPQAVEAGRWRKELCCRAITGRWEFSKEKTGKGA